MKANNTTACEAAPVVSKLNEVKGFNPLQFVRKTAQGYRMDLRYKKLWFRLKYPNGKFKLSALRITDQMAIIEARVYFDKADTEPSASFIAQRQAETTPGGLYIEAAQHAALDHALSDAGFGLQFPENNAESASERGAPKMAEQKPTVTETVPEQTADTTSAQEAEVLQAAKAEAVVEQPKEPVQTAPIQTMGTTGEQNASAANEMAADQSDTAVPADTAAEENPAAEEQTEESASASVYTPDMPVEEIVSRMSYEEACNVKVSEGICKDHILSEVADRRPASLKYYAHGYNGNDNVMRAAARILLSAMEQQKAS